MTAVIRYVATYLDKRTGLRTIATAAQGRHTWATAEEAQAWIDAVRGGTSVDTFRQLWGGDTLEVRPCQCYPGHFDPMGIYFD